MSRILNLELSDEAYAALRRLAEVAGTSPADLAALSLERQFGGSASPLSTVTRTEVIQHLARHRFEHHFGAVDLGHPTGADNASIDADLAEEYAATHESR